MANQPESEPVLHHPTMKEAEKNGLYCFFSLERPCGEDCMAWTPRPDGPDFQDQQWSNCLLLVNAHRVGKHLVVLASIASDSVKAAKTAAADAARTNQPAPPKVG